jgi:hypothetical protein
MFANTQAVFNSFSIVVSRCLPQARFDRCDSKLLGDPKSSLPWQPLLTHKNHTVIVIVLLHQYYWLVYDMLYRYVVASINLVGIIPTEIAQANRP